MNIRTADNSDRAAWDDYVLQHPDGLAYQLFAWKLAVGSAYGFSGRYLLAEEDEGLCGVLPLIRCRSLMGSSSYISLPYCDAAGPLADTPQIEDALVAHARRLALADGASCEIRRTGGRNDGDARQGKVRMILALPESSEALMAGFKSKLRSQVRKPVKDGLSAIIGGTELVADFYSVFCRNMRDLGSPVHSFAWIHDIVSHFGDNARIAVVLTPDGTPAAAGIILLHKKTVSIPWASSLQKYNRMNPNMLLYWTFLSFAADHGFKFFDFGRSTPGEGTFRFKAQWGAEPEPLSWIRYSPGGQPTEEIAQAHPSRARQLVTGVWKQLPLGLVNFFGPKIRRHISL